MTVQTHLPVVPVPSQQLGAPDVSTRMLGSARWLLLHGLGVLAVAIMLGIAEALAVWMGALLVAIGLLLIAACVALVGIVIRISARPHH